MIVKTGRKLLMQYGLNEIVNKLYPFLSTNVNIVTEDEILDNDKIKKAETNETDTDSIITNENTSMRKNILEQSADLLNWKFSIECNESSEANPNKYIHLNNAKSIASIGFYYQENESSNKILFSRVTFPPYSIGGENANGAKFTYYLYF